MIARGLEIALGLTNGIVRIFDAVTWREGPSVIGPWGALTNGEPASPSVNGLAYHPSGQSLAIVTGDGQVRLWDRSSNQLLFTSTNGPVGALRTWFTPDGRELIIQSQRALHRLDAETGHEIFRFARGADEYWAVFADRSGQNLATVDLEDRVQLWSGNNPTHFLDKLNLAQPNQRVAVFSPDGRLVCTAGDPGSARLYDVATGQELFSVPGRVYQVGFNVQGTRLAVTGGERLVHIWDIGQRRELLVLRGHLSHANKMAHSPDGRLIAVAGEDGLVKIWSANPGREQFPAEAWQWACAYSPDGKRVTVHRWWDDLRVWNADSGRLELILKSRSHFAAVAAFSPDGRRIVSVGSERIVRVWDAIDGNLIQVFRGHRRSPLTVAYSPDGRRLAVGVADRSAFGTERGTVELWDLEHGRTLLNLRNHADPLNFVHFSPGDGNRLLTAAMDFATRQEEAFPWDEASYPGPPGTSLPERVQACSREYWRARLAAEHDAGVDAAPRVSSRDSDESLLPRRDKEAGMNLIDLSSYYNTRLDSTMIPNDALHSDSDNDLLALKPGLVTLGGVPFGVRGVVLLRRRDPNGRPWQKIWNRYPERVTGLPVRGRVRCLHILHGATGARGIQDGTPVASLVWHFANGAQRETEIAYGRDVRDWWLRSHWTSLMNETVENTLWGDPNTESERGRVVWTGDNPVAQEAGATLRLYLTTYENPQPEVEVASLDYVSKFTQVAPFLIALTIEP